MLPYEFKGSRIASSRVPAGAGSRRCFLGGHRPRERDATRVLRPKGVVEDASQQVQGHEDSIFPCACRCRVTEMLPGRTPSKGEGCCPSTRPKGVVGDASQRVQGLEDSIFPCACRIRVTEMLLGGTPSQGERCCLSTRPK